MGDEEYEIEVEYEYQEPVAVESLISLYLQLIERLDATERVVNLLVDLLDEPLPDEANGWRELMDIVRQKT